MKEIIDHNENQIYKIPDITRNALNSIKGGS